MRAIGLPAGPPPDTLRAIGALVALAIAAFSYITTEQLPIGLLSVISADLHVSLPAVGLLVTGYGVTVAIVSVPLTYWTRNMARRHLLAGLLGIFVLATLVSVGTSSYAMLLAARVATALSQAVFWSIAAPTAANLFAPHVRGRVIGVLFAGSSVGLVLGVPAGTWIGQQAGWRVAFLALSGLVALTLVAIIALVPTTRPGQDHAAVGSTPDARRYWIVVVTTCLVILGMFTSFTYITNFLTEVSGFSAGAISPLLLLSGAAGIPGGIGSGVLVDRAPRAALITSVCLLMMTSFGLYLLGDAPLPAAILVGLSGFSMGALVTSLQGRVLQTAPGSSELASAGNSSAFNIGISGGAFIGGLLLPGFGVRGTPLIGGLLIACGLVALLSEPLVTTRNVLPAIPPSGDDPDVPTRPADETALSDDSSRQFF